MTNNNEKRPGHFRRNWLFYSVLIISACLSSYLYLSKNMALSKQANAFNIERELIIETATESYNENAQRHLEMMNKTLVWLVRTELINDNKIQIDQYFNQLVKSPNVQEISLVDKNNHIIISTNKENEGGKLYREYEKAILKIEEMKIIDKESNLLFASPILTSDGLLATLLLIYEKDVFQFDQRLNIVNKD